MTDYTNAMQSAQSNGNAAVSSSASSSSSSSSSSADPTPSVSAFFAQTQNFKDVTIDAVQAMQAYYNSYRQPQAAVAMAVMTFVAAAGAGAVYIWATGRSGRTA